MRLDRDLLAPLMDDRVEGDVPLVCLLIGDPCPVGRPPEAGGAIKFLLSDELGGCVGEALPGTVAQLDILLRLQVDDVQLVVAHEGHLGAVATELRINLRAGRLGDPPERPLASQQVEVSPERNDDRPVLLGADDLGDPRLSQPLPFPA
jgi:hypothetical protein